MRDKTQDNALRPRVQVTSSPKSSSAVAVRGYWRLALGVLLVTLLVVFVAQNAETIHVKFLVWETDLSQALLVFLALLSGVVFGVAFNRWQRRRLPRRSER